MKKFSRDERIGAAVLAGIVLALVALMFILRECSARSGESSPEVQIITIKAQEEAQSDSISVAKDTKSKSAKAKSAKKKKGERKKEKTPARDFLKEPIPRE